MTPAQRSRALASYPVQMAADILAMRAHEVPVGAGQTQHPEIAIEVARAFARAYRPGAMREPRAVVAQNALQEGERHANRRAAETLRLMSDAMGL